MLAAQDDTWLQRRNLSASHLPVSAAGFVHNERPSTGKGCYGVIQSVHAKSEAAARAAAAAKAQQASQPEPRLAQPSARRRPTFPLPPLAASRASLTRDPPPDR